MLRAARVSMRPFARSCGGSTAAGAAKVVSPRMIMARAAKQARTQSRMSACVAAVAFGGVAFYYQREEEQTRLLGLLMGS